MPTITLPGAAPPDALPDIVWTPKKVASAAAATPNASIVGFPGEFSRGPVNALVWCPNLDALEAIFGAETANPDGTGNPLNGWPAARTQFACGIQNVGIVRVGTSLLRTAYVTLVDGAGAPVLSVLAATPGTWANGNLVILPGVGTLPNTFKITATNLGTNETPLVIDNLPFGSTVAIATAISMINSKGGNLVKASLPLGHAPAALAPPFVVDATGTLPGGLYRALATLVDATGLETQAGAETADITVPGGATGKITLTLAARPAWAVSTNVYFTPVNGGAGSEVFAGTTTTTTFPFGAVVTSTRTPPVAGAAVDPAGMATTIPVATAVIMPTVVGATTASNGHDGHNAPSSVYFGTAGDVATGEHVFAAQGDHPALVFYPGVAGADTTLWVARAQLAQANNWQAVGAFVRGTSSDAALALWATFKAAAGAYGDFFKVAWNWWQAQDTLLGTAWFSPASLFVGITAAQPYNTAAFNKAVPLVIGTEFAPDRAARIVPLTLAYINVLAPRIPLDGRSYGFWSDVMASGRDGYDVRTNQFLATLVAGNVGWVPGEPNSPGNRATVAAQVTTIFDGEARRGMIPDNAAANLAAVAGTAGAVAPPTTQSNSQGATGVLPSNTAPSQSTLGWMIICDERNNTNPDGTDTDVMNITVICRLFKNARQVVILARVSPFVTTAELQAQAVPAVTGV